MIITIMKTGISKITKINNKDIYELERVTVSIWLPGRSNQFCISYRVLILWYVHQWSGGYTMISTRDFEIRLDVSQIGNRKA